jgi:DNA-binding MarR family transcriptional regulator
VTDDIRDRIAENLLALLPFYHKKIFRAEHGITGVQVAQYRLLGALMKGGMLPMSELGKRLYISKPYMTTLVDQLMKEGYVERIRDTRDRRVINISITPSGIKYLKQGYAVYKDDVKNLLSDLNKKDREELCQSLEKLLSILSRIN